jgi:hypothetical protein
VEHRFHAPPSPHAFHEKRFENEGLVHDGEDSKFEEKTDVARAKNGEEAAGASPS